MSIKNTSAHGGPASQVAAFGAPFSRDIGHKSAGPAVPFDQQEHLFDITPAHYISKRPAATQAQTAKKNGQKSGKNQLQEPEKGCFGPLLRRFSRKR